MVLVPELSGTDTREEAESLGGRILGLQYCPMSDDKIIYKLEPTMIVKHRKNKKEKQKVTMNLSNEYLDKIKLGDFKLTLRMVLS